MNPRRAKVEANKVIEKYVELAKELEENPLSEDSEDEAKETYDPRYQLVLEQEEREMWELLPCPGDIR